MHPTNVLMCEGIKKMIWMVRTWLVTEITEQNRPNMFLTKPASCTVLTHVLFHHR